VFPNEIVNAKKQRDRLLMRFKVFRVAESLALETLQLLPDGQENTLDVGSSQAF